MLLLISKLPQNREVMSEYRESKNLSTEMGSLLKFLGQIPATL